MSTYHLEYGQDAAARAPFLFTQHAHAHAQLKKNSRLVHFCDNVVCQLQQVHQYHHRHYYRCRHYPTTSPSSSMTAPKTVYLYAARKCLQSITLKRTHIDIHIVSEVRNEHNSCMI
ncbi:hypothetical protein GQX74_004118 [Glossina fuscipes]|nr:hypothetical protein GQX74_004118 [Glossina fuscipes]